MTPSKTKIIPPTNSAFLSYLSPNLFPILVPTIDKIKVIIPIKLTANTKLTFKNAKVIPTASAYILVSIARTIIVLKLTSSFLFSLSSSKDSFIIPPPIIASNAKAIQWSILVIKL